MLLPKVSGHRHTKVRNLKIVRLYAQGDNCEAIAQQFGISHQRVSAIIAKNKHLLKLDIDFEKAKRIISLNRLLRKNPERLSPNTDTLDILEALRMELEGNKPNIHIGDNKIMTVVFSDQKEIEEWKTKKGISS